MENENYAPMTGARHVRDARDYAYRDVMSAVPFDWAKGFDVNDALGLPRKAQDQGSSSSCVGQGYAKLCRNVWKAMSGVAKWFSAKWIYAHIFLAGGGAYMRDGAKLVTTVGPVSEESVPSYEGGMPPSEAFMRDCRDTPALLAEAKRFERFDYRAVEGDVDDIEVFARAIRDCHGVNGGFTGTNPGWTRPDIREPLAAESQWGHDVCLDAAGVMDVDGHLFAPKGTKCLFTLNSWGGRYTITSGRWKGYQAIPERYFKAKLTPAMAPGEFVFVGYVLYPQADTALDVRRADLLKRFDRRVLFNADTGEFGWVYDGALHVLANVDGGYDRAALMALMCQASGVSQADWDVLPHVTF